MKFSVLLSVAALAPYALSNSVVNRQASVILNDIATITQQLNQVKSDVDAFQGGTSQSQSQVFKIQSDSSALDRTLQSAGNNAKNSPALSDSDSASVANAVVVLQPNIFNTLTALINKKNDFRTALSSGSAVSLVLYNINLLRRDTNYFGANVTSKLTTSLARAAPLLTGNIDYHFQRAVDAFSTP